MRKFLQNYPFSDPNIRLIEGFSAYDGALGDPIDKTHRGIDYVIRESDSFLSFDVHAMHDGEAFQGTSESWGEYVLIRAEHPIMDAIMYSTVYAHLDRIVADILPRYSVPRAYRIENAQGTPVRAGTKLGRAGTTGWTNNLIQLHVELHANEFMTGIPTKLDPYGIYDRASSGRYPQPDESLQGLEHFWLVDLPPLAK